MRCLKSQTRVLAIITAEVALAHVENSPHGAEDGLQNQKDKIHRSEKGRIKDQMQR